MATTARMTSRTLVQSSIFACSSRLKLPCAFTEEHALFSCPNPKRLHRPIQSVTRLRSFTSSIHNAQPNKSTSAPSINADTNLTDRLRHLMRQSAQPVAIITSFLPHDTDTQTQEGPTSPSRRLVHGATLSSFTTISLDPVPLVAFSIKLPSRMSDTLVQHFQRSKQEEGKMPQPHFIINLLSSSQAHLAAAFAKPGLKPYEWGETQQEKEQEEQDVHPLAKEDAQTLRESERAVVNDGKGVTHGVPLLVDSLGCLACTLRGWIDLGDLKDDEALRSSKIDLGMQGSQSEEDSAAEASGSRLFIARVDAVEALSEEAETAAPLVYWKQGFTTTVQ